MDTKQKAIKRLKENPLDRERWIEAGKAMGWGMQKCEVCFTGDYKGCAKCEEKWLYQATKYFKDYAMKGKSAEEYFKQL